LAEAEKRAAQLKGKHTFAMGNMWMPCANERALHDALRRKNDAHIQPPLAQTPPPARTDCGDPAGAHINLWSPL
jgi:hypothetical protein